MKMKKNLSFRNSLFFFIFSLFCIYTLISLFIVKQSLESSFKEKVVVSQNLFSDSINNDILTGFYSEVFRKCKLFYESGGLDFIQVIDSSGHPICDFKTKKTLNSEIGLIKTHTFFDEKQKIIASTITANYSDLTMRKVLEKSIFIIIFTVILIAIILAFFVNFISRFFGSPVQKISKLLQSSNLNEIANSNIHFKTNFKEIGYLCHSVSEMAKKIIDTQKQLIQKKKWKPLQKLPPKLPMTSVLR
jgi:hypothetical protein